jgi:hypothetical protein
MAVMMVKKLEISQPLEFLEDYEGYEGVRFYCFYLGEFLGFFTIWHYGRIISLFEIKDKLRDCLKSRPELLELPNLL